MSEAIDSRVREQYRTALENMQNAYRKMLYSIKVLFEEMEIRDASISKNEFANMLRTLRGYNECLLRKANICFSDDEKSYLSFFHQMEQQIRNMEFISDAEQTSSQHGARNRSKKNRKKRT